MRKTQVTRLREAYKEYQRTSDINALLAGVDEVRMKFGDQATREPTVAKTTPLLCREDLRLICFDLVCE